MLELLSRLGGTAPTVALTADPGTPIVQAADSVVVLDFADEESVVQTRFATSVLALLRGHLESAARCPPGRILCPVPSRTRNGRWPHHWIRNCATPSS